MAFNRNQFDIKESLFSNATVRGRIYLMVSNLEIGYIKVSSHTKDNSYGYYCNRDGSGINKSERRILRDWYHYFELNSKSELAWMNYKNEPESED